MKNVSIYLESDSTAFQKRKRICGYVLEYIKKNGETKTREAFQEVGGTYHQEILRALAEALGRIREPCSISIYSQNAFVCNMLTNKLPEWADNDFISNGKLVANQEEWRAVWEKIKIHKASTCIGKHSYTDWMLAEMEERFEKKRKETKEHPAEPGK